MSRAAYDRARAEYMESHNRKDRVLAVCLFTVYIDGYLTAKRNYNWEPGNVFLAVRSLIKNEGYDMQQVNAFCDSVQAGLTAPTLRVYARYAARAFYYLQLYVCAGALTKASFLDAFDELPQIENAGAPRRLPRGRARADHFATNDYFQKGNSRRRNPFFIINEGLGRIMNHVAGGE